METIEIIRDSAGLSDVSGFEMAAAACDIRNKGDDRLDLAVVYSAQPCTAAGVFTKNAVKAPPVRICQDLLGKGGPFHGIVVNSGNANACTGTEGLADGIEMGRRAEEATGSPEDSFLVCSTGRIGEYLPMSRVRAGIAQAATERAADTVTSRQAAEAILTSDTRPKTVTIRAICEGKSFTIAGMAKGAGMIQPDMATMLAFLATDVEVSSEVLERVLRHSVHGTFNAITVDGDMSTNDTVLLLANGGGPVTIGDSSSEAIFTRAVQAACDVLADMIVSDGEKITKVVEVKVEGAVDDADAEKVARAIGNSLLVKSSWFGQDPNWGRLADAAGYSGATLEEDRLDIDYGDIPAMIGGRPQHERKPEWKQVVSAPRFSITIRLNLGPGQFRIRASDLTDGYVNFNRSE